MPTTERNSGSPALTKSEALAEMPAHVSKTVEEVVRIEDRARSEMGPSDHVADLITRFSGSMLFIWLHVIWFGVWIGLNVVGLLAFDDFPFGFLTMIVSLEAIFLSTFVLISQNRQSLQADRRAKVDLQVNMIAEQEITKAISLIADIHQHLGLGAADDAELAHMQKETRVDELVEAIEGAEAESTDSPKER